VPRPALSRRAAGILITLTGVPVPKRAAVLDDRSLLAYIEMLPDERPRAAAGAGRDRSDELVFPTAR
jgi:hypothetical protein